MREKKHILIVEDEFIIAQALKFDLEENGISVCGIAARGDNAIELAKQHKPDLIMMDISINGDMDGIDTAKRILQTQQTKIVFMTGYENSDFKERIKQFKHNHFLSKPVDVEMILSLIKKTDNSED